MDINPILSNHKDLIEIRWEEIEKLFAEVENQYNVPQELTIQLRRLIYAQIEGHKKFLFNHFENEIKKIAGKQNSK